MRSFGRIYINRQGKSPFFGMMMVSCLGAAIAFVDLNNKPPEVFVGSKSSGRMYMLAATGRQRQRRNNNKYYYKPKISKSMLPRRTYIQVVSEKGRDLETANNFLDTFLPNREETKDNQYLLRDIDGQVQTTTENFTYAMKTCSEDDGCECSFFWHPTSRIGSSSMINDDTTTSTADLAAAHYLSFWHSGIEPGRLADLGFVHSAMIEYFSDGSTLYGLAITPQRSMRDQELLASVQNNLGSPFGYVGRELGASNLDEFLDLDVRGGEFRRF